MSEDQRPPTRTGKLERVQVCIRVRPYTDDELQRYGRDTAIEALDPAKGTLTIKKDADRKFFTFDHVFDQGVAQDNVYMKVAHPVVEVRAR